MEGAVIMEYMNHLLGEHEEELNEENYQSYIKGPISAMVRKNLSQDHFGTIKESRVLKYWLKKKIQKSGKSFEGLSLDQMFVFVQNGGV